MEIGLEMGRMELWYPVNGVVKVVGSRGWCDSRVWMGWDAERRTARRGRTASKANA